MNKGEFTWLYEFPTGYKFLSKFIKEKRVNDRVDYGNKSEKKAYLIVINE